MIRRCVDGDWHWVRRLHIGLALEFPAVVDVELNEVLSTPDEFWEGFVHTCATAPDQALFVSCAEVDQGATDGDYTGMVHVHVAGATGRVDMLHVTAPARRHGTAKALIRALTEWARTVGATELIGHMPDEGAGAHLAATLGWERTEELFATTHGLLERKWTCPIPGAGPGGGD